MTAENTREKWEHGERPSGHKNCELLAVGHSWVDIVGMSADESAVNERKKAARSHVRTLFERLALPTSSKSISTFSVEDLLDTAVRYKAPADMMSMLEKLSAEC